MYLSSNAISIFPYANPRTSHPDNNAFYEQNTANIIRQLARSAFDKDSFVISWDSVSNTIEFNIYGYWVKANVVSALQQGNSLYAAITIKQNENSPEYLFGQDSGDVFQGVQFENTDVSGEGVHTLKLLEKQANNSWAVPAASRLVLDITRINCQR